MPSPSSNPLSSSSCHLGISRSRSEIWSFWCRPNRSSNLGESPSEALCDFFGATGIEENFKEIWTDAKERAEIAFGGFTFDRSKSELGSRSSFRGRVPFSTRQLSVTASCAGMEATRCNCDQNWTVIVSRGHIRSDPTYGCLCQGQGYEI